MYVGSTDDGSGILQILLEIVANAYDLYLVGKCSKIEVHISANGTVTVDDDGPGLSAQGGDGVPPLDELLAQRSTHPTVDQHRPHVHLGIGGLGMFAVSVVSERFEIISVRDGIEASIVCSRGEIVESISTRPSQRQTGTRVRFRPDPLIFKYPRVPRAELARQFEDLSFLAPRLTLCWSIE